MTRNIGIYIFNDVEVLDFAGPFEVFSTASRVYRRRNPNDQQPFQVFTIGESLDSVFGRGGLEIKPAYAIQDHPNLDIMVIPGGIVDEELKKEKVVSWIGEKASTVEIAASVCNGAFLLAKAGLLDGRQATTHWEDITNLRSQFPNITVKDNTRWIDEGKVVSSAGVSAGIDMSLYLVSRLIDDEAAVRTARQMEYDWIKTRRPHTAER